MQDKVSSNSPVSVPPRRRPRLAVAVVEELVNAIVTEVYPAGTALPPEAMLCDRFEVSRTVVREATTALTEKGLVVSRQGRGTIVCDQSNWNLLDPMILAALFRRNDGLAYLDNLSEIRASLEGGMAAKAARKATPENLSELEAQITKLESLVEMPAAYVQEDVLFHDVIMRMSGDRLSKAIIDRVQSRALNNHGYAGRLSVAHVRETQEAHRRIYDAIAARDPELAARAMKEHIESSWAKRRASDRPSAAPT